MRGMLCKTTKYKSLVNFSWWKCRFLNKKTLKPRPLAPPHRHPAGPYAPSPPTSSERPRASIISGCGFFAYSWKLPAYSGAFSLTLDNFSFFAYSWSFFAYSFSFFTYSWSLFAYSGTVRLIRALRDCKQRTLTVSKKARTVSKKASPQSKHYKTGENKQKILDQVLTQPWTSFDLKKGQFLD